MNLHAVRAIYNFEMARTARTLMQSIISPVLSTSLYFVVFGSAIGSRIPEIGGVSYGAFIVPGLIMLSLLTQSISNASFGIYFPKFTGTIFELLSAPISGFELVLASSLTAVSSSVRLLKLLSRFRFRVTQFNSFLRKSLSAIKPSLALCFCYVLDSGAIKVRQPPARKAIRDAEPQDKKPGTNAGEGEGVRPGEKCTLACLGVGRQKITAVAPNGWQGGQEIFKWGPPVSG